MKKTLIAIAALAAAGASFAQVTVYGKLDAGVVNTAAGGTKFGVLGGYETSRFGIKGEEKAGGLTLSAQLEGKVSDGADGQAAFVGFNRTATVGVSGSMGTVTIGNQWTPFDNAAWTSDALEYSSLTPLAAGLWNTDLGNTGMGNAKNSVQYATPVIGGFQGFVLTAPNVTGNTQGSTNYSGWGVNYANGPLVINFATQAYSGSFTAAKAALISDATVTINAAVAAAQNSTATTNANVLAINYDFGAAKLYGGMVNSDAGTGAKETGFTVGVAVPFGASSLRVGYGSNKKSVTGTADDTHSAWGAMYLMPLSKAALGYAGVGSVDSANTATAGIRYNF